MKIPAPVTVLAPLVFAAGAYAQLFTTTFPWADGNTVILSTGTNAAGLPVTSTVSLITGPAGVPGASASSSSSSSSSSSLSTGRLISSSSSSSSSRSVTSTTTRQQGGGGGAVRPTDTTTAQRVGQDTALPEPMRTTTYWYDPGDGVWTVATWTAANTRAPTVATAIVPAGTVQNYSQYQTSVNARVLASAVASASRAAGVAGKIMPSVQNIVGWSVMGAGVVLGGALLL